MGQRASNPPGSRLVQIIRSPPPVSTKGGEISAFLASREGRGIERFAILDDDPGAGDELAAHFVLVDDGLLDEDLARAAAILGLEAH